MTSSGRTNVENPVVPSTPARFTRVRVEAFAVAFKVPFALAKLCLTLLYKTLLSKARSEALCERQLGEHFLPQCAGPPRSVGAPYEAAYAASAQSALTTNKFEMYAYAGRTPAI